MRRRNKLKNQWVFLLVLITFIICVLMFNNQNQMKTSVNYDGKTTTTTSQTPAFSLAPTPGKYVTKSLKELGRMDEINKYVLFLNQVPGCGAEVLILLLQKLQGLNSYKHIRLKSFKGTGVSSANQEELVYQVHDAMKKEAVPLSFDGRIHFVNFTSYDKQSPTFINLVREPADKMISRSSYINNGINGSFMKCLISGESNCAVQETDVQEIDSYFLSIPYFCGYNPQCEVLNDEWAFETAKKNVEKYYALVGTLEELNATLELLEHKLPYFFKGVQNTYKIHLIDKLNHKKKTKIKPGIRNKINTTLRKEYEFYEWIRMRLFQQLQMLYGDHNSLH